MDRLVQREKSRSLVFERLDRSLGSLDVKRKKGNHGDSL
jgi:hypothetical protein